MNHKMKQAGRVYTLGDEHTARSGNAVVVVSVSTGLDGYAAVHDPATEDTYLVDRNGRAPGKDLDLV